MNITKNTIDDLNAVITVTVDKSDYQKKVDDVLNKYRKTANIKGFRKGQVPMSFIRKQYEKSIVFEEVNKLLQKGVNDYLQEEKIAILGNPLPKPQEDLNWDGEQMNFDFELGIAPEFKVDFSTAKVTDYKIKVTEEDIQKYIDNFANRYGSMKTLEEVEESANIKADAVELDIDKQPKEDGINKAGAYLRIADLKNAKPFIGKKIGEEVVIKAKDLFEKPEELSHTFQIIEEDAEALESDIRFTIKEINKIEAAEVNQELFDKIYGEGVVDSEEAFRDKIKKESEKMYVKETDKHMANEVVEQLLKNTKFDLPKDFLCRWLQFSNESIKSEEEARGEFDKMEEGLRYQLIESAIAEDKDIKVTMEEVKEAAKEAIRSQFAMYGQHKISDEDLEGIIQGTLSNKEEANRLSQQVFSEKLLSIFKENVKTTKKEVTFDEFVEIVTEGSKSKETEVA